MASDGSATSTTSGAPASAEPAGSAGELHRRMGASFAAGGEAYDRLRPGYPDEGVDWLVGDTAAGARVADIGAGTGKLTTTLVERGLDVVAVDPSVDMLAQLSRRLPSVDTHIGTGEDTGLATASVALATFAQSWHWVDDVAGAAELARVLTPGGTVAMVWNFLDVGVEWVAELAEIWHTLASRESIEVDHHTPQLGDGFSPVESITLNWEHTSTVAELAALVTTRSYYLTAGTDEQDRIRTAVAEFRRRRLGSPPDDAEIALPYRTHCFRARRVTP